jgi:hypothetical protein
MNKDESITLGAVEAKQLLNEYFNMADDVRCLALAREVEVLKWARTDPGRLEKWKAGFERNDDRIVSRLSEFDKVLRRALQQGTEPGAAPNGGPAELSGSSGVSGGPPPVS